MYGTRRVRTGAELLGAGRSPLFQEGVTESRLRQRPRAVPSTAPGSAPPARGGKKSSRRRVVAARTVRGVPRGPLSGLRQLPDRRSGGAATGGPSGLGGGNSSASERGGNPGGSQGRDRDSDPRRAGSEANSSDHEREGGIGRKEHQLLADKVERLTSMLQQVADKVLRGDKSSSESEESPSKKVQFSTPTKKKKRKNRRRNRSKDESSELNSSESESSSSGSSVGSFRTPAGKDKNRRAQELERSWEDKLTHLEPEDRATLLRLLDTTNRKVPSSSRLESSLSVLSGLGGKGVSHQDVAELTYDMRRNDQRRIAKAELTKATKSQDAFYDFITKQRAWHHSSPDFGYLTTLFHQARALEKRYGWKAAEYYILDRFAFKADNPDKRWRRVVGKLGKDSNHFLSILGDVRSEIHSKFLVVHSQSGPSGGDKGGKANMHPRFPGKPTKYPKGSTAAKTAANTEYCEDHNAWFKPGAHSPCWMAGKPDGPHRR